MVDINNLHPVFKERHIAFCNATGAWAVSGYRSTSEQQYLYNCYVNCNCNNCNPANKPGVSNHEYGLAVDYGYSGSWQELHARAEEYKIHFPIASTEPWHGQPIEVPYAYFTGTPEFDDGVPTPEEALIDLPRYNVADLHLSSQGAALIADHEGLVLGKYNDPVGHCTFGIGHLIHRGNCDGRDSEKEFDREWTTEEVYRYFIENDAPRYVNGIKRIVTVPLYQSEFDALVSLCFNLGEEGFPGLISVLNSGDYEGAAARFGDYVFADGKKLKGLVDRRAKEAAVFRSEWGKKIPVPVIIKKLLTEDNDMLVEFAEREGGYDGHPAYDLIEGVANGTPVTGFGIKLHCAVFVQRKNPNKSGPCKVVVSGDGWSEVLDVADWQRSMVEVQGNGSIAVVSLNDVPLHVVYRQLTGLA